MCRFPCKRESAVMRAGFSARTIFETQGGTHATAALGGDERWTLESNPEPCQAQQRMAHPPSGSTRSRCLPNLAPQDTCPLADAPSLPQGISSSRFRCWIAAAFPSAASLFEIASRTSRSARGTSGCRPSRKPSLLGISTSSSETASPASRVSLCGTESSDSSRSGPCDSGARRWPPRW